MSVSKTILVGNVGNSPEIRQAGETKVASFSLATSETYKNKAGEKVTDTQWHQIEVWGKLADVVEKWVQKGARLYLEGTIKYETSGEENNKKYYTKIKCDKMQMLGSKEVKKDEAKQDDFSDDDDSALPF